MAKFLPYLRIFQCESCRKCCYGTLNCLKIIYNSADSKVPENHILCISFHPYLSTSYYYMCVTLSINFEKLPQFDKVLKKIHFFCIHSGSALCGLVEWKIIDCTDCHVWPVLTLLIIFLCCAELQILIYNFRRIQIYKYWCHCSIQAFNQIHHKIYYSNRKRTSRRNKLFNFRRASAKSNMVQG